MTQPPVLYSFRRCPYAIRARMALLASDTPFEIREVTLRAKPAAMIAASPKATVPVLVLAGGKVIDESLDIMHWALAGNDPEDWLAGSDPALIASFDDRFKHHLDRYKYPERHGDDPIAHRQRGLEMLVTLEQRLSTYDQLSGAALSITDIALMPFIRQFAAVDRGWFADQPVPRLRQWLARHLATPVFAAAMTRLPPWAPGDPAIVWPTTAQFAGTAA